MYRDALVDFGVATWAAAQDATTHPDTAGPLEQLAGVRSLEACISVEAALSAAADSQTLTITIQTDDASTFGSATTIATIVVATGITALSAGTKYFYPIPVPNTDKYIRAISTPSVSNLTGTVRVFLTAKM